MPQYNKINSNYRKLSMPNYQKLHNFPDKILFIPMKKTTILLLLSFFYATSYCQNDTKYSALLLNLEGEGIIKRSSQTFELQMPQFFTTGDNLTLKKGNALIMLFSGEEVHLKANSNYKIPENINKQASDVQKLSEGISSDYGLLAQAGAAYSIRGIPQVYPLKSRLLNVRNAILRVAVEETDSLSPVIKVIDSQTQKVLFEKPLTNDSTIMLSDVPFQEGCSYYWTISGMGDNQPRLGSIIIPDKTELSQLKNFQQPSSNLDYITAISYYYNNKYFFEALALTEQAIEKFPDVEIYRLFLENLKNE
jgi:hypothetical protein